MVCMEIILCFLIFAVVHYTDPHIVKISVCSGSHVGYSHYFYRYKYVCVCVYINFLASSLPNSM